MKEISNENLLSVFQKMDRNLLNEYFSFSVEHDDELWTILKQLGAGPKNVSEATSLLSRAAYKNNIKLAEFALSKGAEIIGWTVDYATGHPEMENLLNSKFK